MTESELDLRGTAPSRVQTAAFHAVRDLARGSAVILLTDDNTVLLMESLNLQLRDLLAWETQAIAGGFRTRVVLREETEPTDVIDLLTRDHRRLDERLAIALRRVNAGDMVEARRLIADFAAGLARHLDAEDVMLAEQLPQPAGAGGESHVAIMLREHVEIRDQLAEVEAGFGAAEPPEPWEVEPFIAILSGTLAKHEYREETNLFPHWRAALARLGEREQADLLAKVRAVLAG
jgi:iron-sulfur cluster repair protein YtfE (RIC family)